MAKFITIKNSKELINDGYFFKTDSDTEVFLAFILSKGINAINKINGIFGAFIFDEYNKKIFLIRDQIGVKPIYYLKNNPLHNFVFASEIKALKPFINLRPSINELGEFCCFEKQVPIKQFMKTFIKLNLDITLKFFE